ncbi:hypothetical protein FRAAL4601 [Frankia alni ACN14a]|uniref:Uncharacterized protein n=1 Tax=Frankia alni (strain DSM 45986 / CECT 9034 / ACN14a) TaxID=326424 RepID=Q0RGZ2_FRAAA|nr:hypothetical protein FRAAL4601 [Frankia alni ACN14a]
MFPVHDSEDSVDGWTGRDARLAGKGNVEHFDALVTLVATAVRAGRPGWGGSRLSSWTGVWP